MTMTTWLVTHKGRRENRLMIKEFADTIPSFYANEGADVSGAIVGNVKLFSTYSSSRSYITE